MKDSTIPTRPLDFTGTVLLGAPTTDGTWHVARVTVTRDGAEVDSADRAEARGTTYTARDLVDAWGSAPAQGVSVLPTGRLEGTGLYLCQQVPGVDEARACVEQVKKNLASAWHEDDEAREREALRDARADLVRAMEAERVREIIAGRIVASFGR